MCGLFVLFKYNATISQEHQADTTWVDKPSLHSASQPSIVTDLPLSTKRDSLFADRESQLDSLLPPSTMSIYGQDSSLSGLRSSALSRPSAPPIVTTVSNFKHHIISMFYLMLELPWELVNIIVSFSFVPIVEKVTINHNYVLILCVSAFIHFALCGPNFK